MKYAIVKTVNGAFTIDSEWNEDINQAIVQFHSVCKTLWNESTVERATVAIVDDDLNPYVNGKEYIETIRHTPV